MKRPFNVLRNVFSIIGLLVAVAIVAIAFVFYPVFESGISWFSEEKEIYRLPSPGKEYDGVVTVQEPGAFGSSIVRLYVVPSGLAFTPKAEGFKFEMFRSHTIRVNELIWEGDRTLVIKRGRDDKIYHFDPRYYDVRDKDASKPAENWRPENWRQVLILLETI